MSASGCTGTITRVAAEIHGPLDENQYVIDFVALRDILSDIVAELDHHVLLPTSHPTIHVKADEQRVEVRFEDRHWVFPRGDCVLLPVANTTAELLARYIGQRMLEALAGRGMIRPTGRRVEVDECFGQVAVWDWKPE